MSFIRLSALAVVLAGAVSANAFFDDFNRANSGNLGANWTLINSTTQIVNNQATNGSTTTGLSTVVGFSSPYAVQTVSMDVFAGGSLGYCAAVLGVGSDQVFVKVQGSGTFTNYGFYHGNNTGGWGSNSGFFTLASSFSSGRMTVSFLSNDTVQLGIDTNFDNVFDQTYSANGVSSLSLGTGAGIGLYGAAIADNYSAVPEPASIVALGSMALIAIRRRRR